MTEEMIINEKSLQAVLKQYDELEQENKELKNIIKIHDSTKYDYYKLMKENKELKKQIESQKGLITVGGKQQYEMTMAYDKCKTALEEIREIADKCKECLNEDDDCGCDYLRIVRKINEVLGND